MENVNMSFSQKSKNSTRAHPYAQSQRQKSTIQQTSANSISNALAKKSTNHQTSSVRPTNKVQSRQNIISNYDLNPSYSYEDYSSKWGNSTSTKNVSSINNKSATNSSTFLKSNGPPLGNLTNSLTSIGLNGAGVLKGFLTNKKPHEKVKSSSSLSNRKVASTKSNADTALAFEVDKKDFDKLKFLSGNTKSIEYFTRKFEEVEIAFSRSNHKTTTPARIGSHLFEIIAYLDSSVVQDLDSKVFSVKDNYGRMHCIYYENELPMPKIVRGSLVRCVGKFSLKDSTFKCVTIREADFNKEAQQFENDTARTNMSLKLKYILS